MFGALSDEGCGFPDVQVLCLLRSDTSPLIMSSLTGNRKLFQTPLPYRPAVARGSRSLNFAATVTNCLICCKLLWRHRVRSMLQSQHARFTPFLPACLQASKQASKQSYGSKQCCRLLTQPNQVFPAVQQQCHESFTLGLSAIQN